jgi:hypothetical protein
VGAGARNETSSNAGVIHCIRNLAFDSTQFQTAVRITREAEIRGARLSATCGRDYITYQAQCLRGDAAFAAGVLAETVAAPLQEAWTLKKQLPRIQSDVAAMASNVQLGACSFPPPRPAPVLPFVALPAFTVCLQCSWMTCIALPFGVRLWAGPLCPRRHRYDTASISSCGVSFWEFVSLGQPSHGTSAGPLRLGPLGFCRLLASPLRT